MNNFLNEHKLEKGQVIPLIVIMLIAIIGMVALILDGGSVMSNRRTAQAAADAGALAGAQRACSGLPGAQTVAETYAANNNATSSQVTITGKQITVIATVERPSFFAAIFGEETLTATGEATAGCYGVRGTSVLPLAWYCRAPSVGGPFPEEYGCQMQTISWELLGPLADPNWTPSSEKTSEIVISDFQGNEKLYFMSGTNVVDSNGIPPEQIYIIIESDKVCLEDGGDFKCDLDGDGKKDLQLGGDRGWLYLTADTSNIDQWLTSSGSGLSLHSHQWLSGKSGVSTSVYNKLITYSYSGQVVMVPVYNELCDGDPRTDTSCVAPAHASPPWPFFDGVDDFSQIRNTSVNYHIITFAPFYMSCVSTSGDCPGYRYAQTLNSEMKDGPVVEGFFLSDVDVSPDSAQICDINLGNCTISLSK